MTLEAAAGAILDRHRDVPGPHRLNLTSAAIIVMFGATMLLTGLGSGRVLTYHEVVFAEPAKEMLATGNWVLPKFGGVPITDKPPAMNWSIAACMTLLGSTSEFVVRLPAVMAVVATALLVGWLAARWFGGSCGLVAALIHLTTVHAMTFGRLGECDVLLAATVTAAMSVFAAAHIDSPSGRLRARWAPWLFYLLVMLSFFVKWLVGPVFILAACGGFAILQRDWRGLRFLLDPLGLLILVVPPATWFALAYAQHPGIVDNFLMHHVARYNGDMGLCSSGFVYFHMIPLLMLPWTPFLVLALARGSWGGWLGDPRWRLLVAWFVPGMMILAASAWKAKHYTLPLLPPLAILSAQGLLDHLARRLRLARLRSVLLAVAVIAGFGVAMALVERGHANNAHEIGGLIGVAGAGSLAVIYCERRRRVDWLLATMFATGWIVSIGVQLLVTPSHDSYRPQAELAARIRQVVPAGHTIYMLYLSDNQIAYYLDRPIVRIDLVEHLPPELEHDPAPERFVVAPKHLVPMLVAEGGAEVVESCPSINRWMAEQDRLTFLSLKRPLVQQASRGTTAKLQ